MSDSAAAESEAEQASDTEVFLASRFREFRAVRVRLNDLFSASSPSGPQLSLLDYNSSAKGKPPILDFCLAQARAAPVFVLLVGKTYPRVGTGHAALSISHEEYLEALKAPSDASQIFVFLIGEHYRDSGASAPARARGMRQLLATVAAQASRPNHLVTVIPDGKADEIADKIHFEIVQLVRARAELQRRRAVSGTAHERLTRVLMRNAHGDSLELGPARERLAGANESARKAFQGRRVPENPFPRSLFRMDDSGNAKICDFETQLERTGASKVVGIVSPSGQGKSTFVSDFPSRYELHPSEYVILTGRELTRQIVDELMLSVAQVAKCMALQKAAGAGRPPQFHVLVDALNECSRADSLLLHLIVWLETLLKFAARAEWPLTVLLTMRPDVAKTVPELSRELVRAGNTYDLEPFSRREYRKCAVRHRLRTPWDSLRLSTQKLLGDPFMLALTGQLYAGRHVPLYNTDLKLLSDYLDRLAKRADADEPDKTVLQGAQDCAGLLLARNTQTLTRADLSDVMRGSSPDLLLSSGILTDAPERASARAGLRCYGFRYDRVAELLIGRHVADRLHELNGGMKFPDPLAIQRIVPVAAGLGELHWTGLALGLLTDLQQRPQAAADILIALMTSDSTSWRMLARTVLLRMQLDHQVGAQPTFDRVVKELVAHAQRHREQKEFRAELMRAAYELIREHDELDPTGASASLEPLMLTLCVGLNSRDQEIADLAITSLSSLIARPRLVPAIERHVRAEVQRIDLSVASIFGKQLGARLEGWWREFRGGSDRRRPLVIPVDTFVKLLVVCFASSLDESGHAASVALLADLLRRFRTTALGRTVGSAFGRSCMLMLLGTLLEVVLRRNVMPINAKEWKLLVEDPHQFRSFKSTMRMVDPAVQEIDGPDIVGRFANEAPSPFIYQTLVTALSTKYELVPSLREAVLQTVKGLIDVDRGDGVAKYVASLVLYHINTFGNHGTQQTAEMMIDLAGDILRNHDGNFVGQHRVYNSNIIGTTGRSLKHLADRGVLQGDRAFDFIRSQMAKIESDRTGEFTEYLIGNLALLAVLLPENVQLMRLLKEEIYEARMQSTAAVADGRIQEWLIHAFVRIRAAHPAAVDNYLLRRDDSALYHEVRERHAAAIQNGDSLGLDGEIVSWSFERIAFDILTRATPLASRANKRWCDGMDRLPRLRPSCMVELGVICFEESLAWAEAPRRLRHAPTLSNSANTP